MSEAVEIAVDLIDPNFWNPNQVPEPVMAALRENMRRVGFVQPILVRPHPDAPGRFQIVDGEHRWIVARDEGAKTVTAYVRDMSDAEAKAQTLAMNKLRGEMAPEQVARLVRQMDMSAEEVALLTGYNVVELRALDRLLDERLGDAMVKHGGSGDEPEEGDAQPKFVRLAWRVPDSVARVFLSELTLRKDMMGQGTEDWEAIREVALRSAMVPTAELERDAA